MIGIYFSGTGNTRYCLEEFLSVYDDTAEIASLEEGDAAEKIRGHRDLILAYPIYFSSLPKIVSDFIDENAELWKDKNIFILATMGLFSGDGAGCAARKLRKYQAKILGGLHLKMPDCISDVKALKRGERKNKEILRQAERKLRSAALLLKEGRPTGEGLSFLSHMAGLFGQRLWFGGKTRRYSDRVKIDAEACIGCGNCVCFCPMKNLSLSENRAKAAGRCTLCYRCVNRCPKQAIRILGRRVIVQHSIEDFI